jgi:SAM-dependent methyltransferase
MDPAIPQIIDGIKCYAPESAFANDNYSPEAFDRLYKAENKNFWFRSRNRVIRNLVRKYSDGKDQFDFLEIGCGTGYVLKGLSEMKNLNLMGAEIFVEGLKYTRQRIPGIELVQLDAIKMPFQNRFDAVGAFDVLEHIEEDEAVMKQVNLSLKPGGYFLISVPQHKWMWSYLDDMAYHKRRYSRKELKAKLERAGFRVDRITSFVFLLFPLMWLSRLAKKKKKAVYNVDDQMKEIELGGFTNSAFGLFMKMDEVLIRSGVSLPFGGSLVAVAQKK